MHVETLQAAWPFIVSIIMLFIIGLYCLLATLNLIRALIGIELLIKAVTLLLVLVGYYTGRTALMQSLVLTLIVIEVVIMTVAVGVVLGIHRYHNSLDVRNIRKLKG